MKIAWLSDIHLDYLSNEKFVDFVNHLIHQPVEACFLTGDISHGLYHETVFNILQRFLCFPLFLSWVTMIFITVPLKRYGKKSGF